MAITIECLSIDTNDPATLARWWADALQWQIVEEDDDEIALQPPDGGGSGVGLRELLFARVPEGKQVKNRLHLDLRPDDQGAEVARFESLGARRVDVGQPSDVTWVVLSDPEGNEFCILRSRTAG